MRTGDLFLTKEVLCRLSYVGGRLTARAVTPADGVWGHRKRGGRAAPEHWTGPQVDKRETGIEPATPSLEGSRSAT